MRRSTDNMTGQWNMTITSVEHRNEKVMNKIHVYELEIAIDSAGAAVLNGVGLIIM
ncbi:hypothetical protein ACKUB1_17925 [Methanospirillum stamsii]|uniref:hypothetical protein n=1 Tax=Methanospirillum stamsii TaxID=1277351 RepID=UPI0015E83C98|nr:hypothetical protein [Methanospirillum stamsii]